MFIKCSHFCIQFYKRQLLRSVMDGGSFLFLFWGRFYVRRRRPQNFFSNGIFVAFCVIHGRYQCVRCVSY